VRDHHENDPRRVHPLADLCYHMVLRYHRLEREIDVENISPFNTFFAPSFSLSLSLFFALSQHDAVDISTYVGMCSGTGTLLTFFFHFARRDTRKGLCLVRSNSWRETLLGSTHSFALVFPFFPFAYTLPMSSVYAHRLYFIFG